MDADQVQSLLNDDKPTVTLWISGAKSEPIRSVYLEKGQTGGIGLGFKRPSLQTAGHNYKVTEIVPGSSTDQSGIIRIGDTLLSVNGKPIHELTSPEVIELIKSQPGSSFPGKTANPDDVQ